MKPWEKPLALLFSIRGLASVAAAVYLATQKARLETATDTRWIIGAVVALVTYALLGKVWAWLTGSKSTGKRAK
ncbi:hypothetical protein [Streptomyces sp. NPDC051993]|uniref:hypothetical protein n=1 Tax=Streptomyces sp. NPDC051993 TaxID=3155286 RepID=UPI003435292F